MRMRSGPRALWLVRHGESAGNVARAAAYRDRSDTIDVQTRDADAPLTATGERQARAFGRWLGAQPRELWPTTVLTSPYLRAGRTARIALDAAGGELAALPVDQDERLRDREMGVLDALTWRGVEARHPAEAARAARLGKAAYRPPGGESWHDIALRLRSVYADVARDLAEDRVLVVAHDAVIQLTRVVVEGLTEAEVLAAGHEEYRNCALSCYERTASGYTLTTWNDVVGKIDEM